MLNHKDDLIDQQVHGDQSDVRSYECTYCKHGFTNAQALGGHMNVHRKDRAKNRFDHDHDHDHSTTYNNKSRTRSYEPSLISIHDDKQEMKTLEFLLIRSSPRNYDTNLLSNYQNPNYGSIAGPSDQEEMRLSLSLSLNLEFGRSHEEGGSFDHGGNEDDELDLELRLGQDPWNSTVRS